MLCRECGREISDESVFCMFCGTEQDFEETDAESFSEDQGDPSARRRDELAPGEKESELLTSLRDVRKRRFSDPLTISLISLSAVLLVAFLALLFGRPLLDRSNTVTQTTVPSSCVSSDPTRAPVRPDQPAVIFASRQIQLTAGEKYDLKSAFKYDAGVSLRYLSSNPEDIEIDGTGTVTGRKPGSSAVIEVASDDGSYLSETIRIVCLSAEDSELIEETARLNNRSSEFAEIEIGEIRFMPAKRNSDYFWDKTLFYTLEDFVDIENDGRINSYRIDKRKMRETSSGNVIEYEIYRSPTLGIVNKIVSIEYLPDSILEISEYYFENDGTLNFVFVHRDTSYTPSRPAAPNIFGDRYYFRDDVMVKWRTVEAGSGVRDIVIGEKEKSNTQQQYIVTLYSEAEEDARREYDELERKILNRAYSTYVTVLAERETGRIFGSVVDETGSPLENVSVALVATDMNEIELYRTVTDSDGRYTIFVPSGAQRFALFYEAEGFVSVYAHSVDVSRRDVDMHTEPVKMLLVSAKTHSVRMVVADAVEISKVYPEDEFATEMLRIPRAEIRLREGVGNVSGNVLQTVYTDLNGVCEAFLPSGAYTAEIIADGYESSRFNLYSYAECAPLRYFLSPTLNKGDFRVVLSWGAEPADLDAHLFTPFSGPESSGEAHIWFRSREDPLGNRLDVDAIKGFGPETVTVSAISEGSYKYYVTDFTHCIVGETFSTAMSRSGALVQVYSENGLIQSFYVPSGGEGVIWEVFEIRGRSVVPIHRYYSSIADKPWWNTDKA